jgi:predicted CXXCH cytochrome family protein
MGACLALAVSPAFAGISGTAHDFSSETWNSSGEICVVCHAPHSPDPGDKPLWNHTLTTETFTMYGTTIAGTDTASTPNLETKMCLSCHDGVTKLDAFGGAAGTVTIGAVPENFGLDLSDDHPVSIAITPGSKGIKSTLGSNVVVFNNNVECASCHDPHDNTKTDFLRASNAASALCLECHDK